MTCPNCGFEMSKKGYCMHCGYMSNGNIIDTKKAIHASDLELYFGEDYDKIVRNKNWFVAGILGPTYIFCRNHYLVGLILIIIDTLISLFFCTINAAFRLPSYNKFYFMFNRVIWATINNLIYVKLTERSIKKYKEKNPENFDLNIQDKYKKDMRLLLFKYVCFGLIFLIICVFFQLILDYYASLA